MKITKRQLRRVINEEIQRAIGEGMVGDFFADEEGGVQIGQDSAAREFAEQQQSNYDSVAKSVVSNFKRKIMDFLKKRNPSMWNVHGKQVQGMVQSLESAVKVSSSGGKVMVSIAPEGMGGVGQNWLQMDIEATVEVPQDSDGSAVYLGFHVNSSTGGGGRGSMMTDGESFYPDDLHIQIEDLLRQASLRSVGKSFPKAKDVQGEGGYIAMIPIQEGIDVDSQIYSVLQQLFGPFGSVLRQLLKLNAYPWFTNFTDDWEYIQREAHDDASYVLNRLKSF